MKKSTISISKKFFIYSSFLLIYTFSYSLYLIVKQNCAHNTKIISTLSNQTINASKEIGSTIEYVESLSRNIINEIKNNSFDEVKIAQILENYRVTYNGKLRNISTINTISWIDKDANLSVDSEVGKLNIKQDVSDRKCLIMSKKTPNKMYLGEPTIGVISKRRIIPASIGVTNRNHRFIGSLIAGLDADNIYRRITKNIDNTQQFQLFYKLENITPNPINITSEFLDKIELGKEEIQILKKPGFFNKKVILYKSIYGSDYGVVLVYNDPNKNYISNLSTHYFFQITLLIIIFFLFTLSLKLWFINPVTALSKAVNSILEGKLDVEMPKSNIKEINDLSATISSVKHIFNEEILKNRKIIEANLEKSSFLSSVSHQLRSPAISISSIADLLLDKEQRESLDEADKIKFIRDIKDISDSALEFIVDLVDIAKIDLDNLELEEYDFNDLVRRSIKIVIGKANKNSIQIETDLRINIPKIKCDARKIKQILINLLIKSIKYSSPGSTIFISTSKLEDDKKSLKLIIEDQGIGMSKNLIDEIIHSEFKNNQSIDYLGLKFPLIKHLINIQGGSLEIKSEPGHGTQFIIKF